MIEKKSVQRLLSCENHDIIRKERGEWINSVFKGGKSKHTVRKNSADYRLLKPMGKSSDCVLSTVANH